MLLNVFFLCVILVELVLISTYAYSEGAMYKWIFSLIAFVVTLTATMNYNCKLATKYAMDEEVIVENYYYVDAEIRDVKMSSNGKYDVEFIVIDSHGVTHCWENESPMEDIPYLLTIKTNGTETIADDEIVAVWKCAN